MGEDSQRDELLALFREVGEQLEYLRELGVENFEFGAADPDAPRAAPLPPGAHAADAPAAGGEARQSSALRRNAEVESRQSAAEAESRRPANEAEPGGRVEAGPPASRAAEFQTRATSAAPPGVRDESR
jgi:hypothetical protein